MTEVLLVGVVVLLLADSVLLALLLLRRQTPQGASPELVAQLAAMEKSAERTERGVREEIGRVREESASSSRQLREEMGLSLKGFGDSVLAHMTQIGQFQKNQLDTFAAGLTTLAQTNEKKLEEMRQTMERKLAQLAADATQQNAQAREELAKSLKSFADLLATRMSESATLQKNQLDTFATNLAALTASNEQKLEQMRQTVEAKLLLLQQDNAQKLEQMRATVDEKLHATLEQRLGDSFKIVSERLEQVHKGLGEMQSLANGVGDLKKVLTNVKTRGCWGEIQLGNLLEQLLTPDQYATNVATNPQTADRVEFAVKLPGRDESAAGHCVYLPIDAKFPQEDYQRLVEAQERADAEAVSAAGLALESRVRSEARKIHEKYIAPPDTTDFAIMFLPTEGLFAEVLRRPGLCDGILHAHRVVISGPTTLAALLSSLQMGFRTLAIEKRSSEVWQVLGAVKTEFTKFGDVLDKVQKKLQEASNTIDTAQTRSRVLQRKLTGVQQLPTEEAAKLLGQIDGLGIAADGQDDDEPRLLPSRG